MSMGNKLMAIVNIIVCKHCKGKGVIEREERIDHHKGDYNKWTEECSICNGSGLLKETSIITIEPYKPARPSRRSI